MAARLQLVEDMEGDSERDAVRDAEQFVDQVAPGTVALSMALICMATWCHESLGIAMTPSSLSTRWRPALWGLCIVLSVFGVLRRGQAMPRTHSCTC
jgi:hypothetical protein